MIEKILNLLKQNIFITKVLCDKMIHTVPLNCTFLKALPIDHDLFLKSLSAINLFSVLILILAETHLL